MKRTHTLLLAALALTGCAPITEAIYAPYAQNGTVQRSFCNGSSGPNDTIVFSVNGLTASAHAFNAQHKLNVTLQFDVRENQIVKVLENRLQITLAGSGSKSYLSATSQSMYVNQKMLASPIESPMLGPVNGPDQSDRQTKYYIRYESSSNIDESFDISMPHLLLNGAPLALPPISFRKERTFYVLPLNC